MCKSSIIDGDTIKLRENSATILINLKKHSLNYGIMKKEIETEIWKPIHIEPYNQTYMVSNLGRVKNVNTKNILSCNSIRSGYKSACLSYNGKNHMQKVHRLVAHAFLPIPDDPEKRFVNHINGDKLDNRMANLEWVTPRENVVHGFDTGLTQSLERPVQQFTKKGKFIQEFRSIKIASQEIGINDSCIIHCCKNSRSTAGGFKWKYTVIHEREKLHENKPDRLKQVEGFPNYYVSDDGRVLSVRYKKYLKPHKNADGYLHIQLQNNGKGKDFLIHRLVAIAYIDNPENKRTVNHINGVKTDNHVNNLEWNTYSENNKHAYRLKKERSEPIIQVEEKVEYKVCDRCSEKQDIKLFKWNICIECRRKKGRENYYKKHDYYLQQKQKQYIDNKDKIMKYREENSEHFKKYRKEYHEKKLTKKILNDILE